MKEPVDIQAKISAPNESASSAGCSKKIIFRMLLAAAAFMSVPILLEVALALIGYGEPTSFLVDSPVPEQEAWVDNAAFTAPFFSRGLERTPAPIAVPKAKNTDELRVLVLGASAAMGDPMPEFGFPRVLQAHLESATDKRVRVINAAITAINSHVVRVIAEDCLKLEPDAVIIYLGNNEIIGPFGPGTIFSGFYNSRAWIRTSIWLRRTRTGRLLSSLRDTVAGQNVRSEWGGMTMFLDRQVSEDDPGVAVARDHFKANVKEVARLFAEHNVPVVLSTVAVNLDDFPPLLAPEKTDIYTRAKRSEAEGDRVGAWKLFQKACDEDRFRFRADSGFNNVIREVSQSGGVTSVDAADHFRSMYINGTPAHELFVDHVHFTFKGNDELARLAAAALADLLPLDRSALNAVTEDVCRERLAYTPYIEREIWKEMQNRFLTPLFRQQPDSNERLLRVVRDRQRAERRMDEQDVNTWLDIMNTHLEKHPDDADLLLWRGRYLLGETRRAEALADFEKAARIWPHRITPRGHVSFLQTIESGASAAIELFRKRRSGPQNRAPAVMHFVGSSLRDNGRLHEAEEWFAAGAEADPAYPGMLTHLAHVRLLMDNAASSIPVFEQALRLDPNDRKAMSYLGVAYSEQQQWRKGLQYLKKAVELAPDDAAVRYNYAAGLLKDGKADLAAAEFQRVIADAPVDANAYVECVEALWTLGDYQAAVTVCEQARTYIPEFPAIAIREPLLRARLGDIDAALRRLAELEGESRRPVQQQADALAAWLAATREGEVTRDDRSVMSPYMRKGAGVSASDPSATQLIYPAVLIRLGRTAEAEQQVQSARIFLGKESEEIKRFVDAMHLAVKKGVVFSVPESMRASDPVLTELWEDL